MLRAAMKKQITELLDSMCQQHHKGIQGNITIMEECQQAAITIGETLEKKIEGNEPIVTVLERYCDLLYELTQKESVQGEDIEQLDELLFDVKNKVNAIQTGYQVVFFPYKAAMWDSLESIWMAFRQDKNCECIVVPIPYKEFHAQENKWEPCYELEAFPDYLSVRDYRNYSVMTEQPDIAFIHNPYDDWNRVTCVEPQFFSRELKKYVGKLVYVPYYITNGFISPEQRFLPVYENMDYMVAQSEHFKDGCRGMKYFHKILPFGSPKADRVIRMCREGVEIPKEWEQLLQGKKSVMLNTSIGCFLGYGDIYFDKLLRIFQWFKAHENIVLIWRPHPLLESTVKSMKPHLLEKYRKLVNYYQANRIGIWDDTADITRTVAVADAYIGEDGSSVVNLFGVAGKPIFILDNTITEPFSEAELSAAYLMDIACIRGEWYATSGYNGVFKVNGDFDRLELVTQFENQPEFAPPYNAVTAIQDTLYLSPGIGNTPVSYRVDSGETKQLREAADAFCQWQSVIAYGNKLYYLPAAGDEIWIYHYREKTWSSSRECIMALKQNVPVTGGTVACSYVEGHYLWMTAEYTNRIIRYDMKNDTYQLLAVGPQQYGYTGIVVNREKVWLLEAHSGNVICLNIANGSQQEYRKPDDFYTWAQENGRRVVYRELFDMGKYLVATPCFTNVMLKLDKKTGEMTRLIPQFWERAVYACNGYHPRICSACCFAKKLDETHLVVQRWYDGALAIVDIVTEEYTVRYPKYTQATMRSMLDGQDGFEKWQTYYTFCQRESRLFSLEGFMDDLVNDRLEEVKPRQKEALSVVAANLDGTCGEKVYEFFMDTLQREQRDKV